MPDVKNNRIADPLAWIAAALLCQFCIVGATSVLESDGEVSRSLLFGLAEFIAIGGVLCGLIGYTLLARLRPSSLAPVISLVSGAAFAAVMIVTFRVGSHLTTPSVRVATDIVLAIALGAASYFLASRISTNATAAN